MNIFTAILFIFTTAVAASYAWGMRGTTIGGEKGAMLPGAVIGTLIAVFSGIPVVRENFFIFAALGAVGMYFGGSMTYGETLSFSMSKRPAENMKKGLAALFVKGGVWFGVFAGVFSVGLDIICGRYTVSELIILLLVTLLSSAVFYLIFNRPFKPSAGIFPKIYFSKTRSECWGAMFGAFAVLLSVSIVKKSSFSILFISVMALSGAIGWVLAQLLQVYFLHYASCSNNKLFRKLGNGHTDTWKIMECTLGAVGGLGASFAVTFGHSYFADAVFPLEKNAGAIQLTPSLFTLFTISWFVLLGADVVHYFIKKPLTKSDIKKKYNEKLISKQDYYKLKDKAPIELPKRFTRYDRLAELSEPLLYAVIPFILIALGDIEIAKTVSFFIILWVLLQEIFFEKVKHTKLSYIFIALSGIFITILNIIQFSFGLTPGIKLTVIMYTVIYELLTILWILLFESKENETPKERILSFVKNRSLLATHTYFTVCCIAVTLIICLV